MVYSLSKLICWPLLRLFIKDIKGVEHLPKGPYIMVANHSSYIDPVILVMMVAWHQNKKLCIFATKERFTGAFWDFWFDLYGAIRVNGSLKKGLTVLRKGHCMGIFPEGGRTTTGRIQKVTHGGLGVLALQSKKPVVPVHLNTYNWWNVRQYLPNFKRNITIHIGKPLTFKKKVTKANARAVVQTIMNEVKHLA